MWILFSHYGKLRSQNVCYFLYTHLFGRHSRRAALEKTCLPRERPLHLWLCDWQDEVTKIAFWICQSLKLKHKFNRRKKIAGYVWLALFLRRNHDIMARGRRLCREKVNNFCDLLGDKVKKHDLQKKPMTIRNTDEPGLQLINRVGKVLDPEGSKAVHKITTIDIGEKLILVALC